MWPLLLPLFSVGRCLYFAFGNAGLSLFDEWSKDGEKYKKGEPASLWKAFAEEDYFAAPLLIWLLRKAKKAAEAAKRNYLPDTGAMALAQIEVLNENNAVVTRGGKTVVLYESYNATCERFTVEYLAKDEFCKKYVRHVTMPEGDEQGSAKGKNTRQLGSYWFGSSWRRQYDHVRFAPGLSLDRRDLNLWTGFAFDPTNDPDGWDKFKQHLLHHVARGDQKCYDYILNWMAFGVQQPEKRVGTALVLVGKKGAGKSVVISLYGRLFEPHAFVTSNESDITGRFNGKLETTVLLGIEEAFAPQDRKADGILKDLITRNELRLEDKFFSVWTAPNHLNVIMTSNNDHVVRADLQERRYAVFNVSTSFENDPNERFKYFRAVEEQMENGGYEAMLGELLVRDIKDWNPEAIPDTPALQNQKIANLVNDPVVAWYYERLQDGIDITTGLAHPMAVTHKWHVTDTVHGPVREVLDDIAHFAKGRGLQFSEHKVKAKLQEFMPEGFKSATQWKFDLATHKRTDSYKAYPFPPIEEARCLFTKATGLEFDD